MSLLKRLSVYVLGRGEPDASKVLFGDGWWRVPSASGGPATQIQESSGPTTLTIGAIADGEFAKRVGATLVGAAAGGGGAPVGASYVVLGLDATLTSERKLVAGTGISLTDGGAGGNATLAADIGTGAGQVASATDARLSDARTPTAHASSHQPGGSDAMAVDAAAATGSLRTLGTGAAQAAAGNDSRLSDDRTASGLRSATTVVVVSAAAAPSSGQVLTATGASAATWQTPAAGGAVGGGGAQVGGHIGGSGLARTYVAGQLGATAITTGLPSTGTLRAIPLRCPMRSGTIDQIAVYVSTLLAASTVRIGIYRNTSESNLYPGALIAESAALSSATTGLKTLAVSVSYSPGEILWLAYHGSSSATLAIRCLALAGCDASLLGVDANLITTPGVGLSVAHVYGAFPNPFTAGAAVIVATPIPALSARFSA